VEEDRGLGADALGLRIGLEEGTLMIVKFGANPARSSWGGLRNRFRAKMLAHADSV
jgi:hypothetical protein